MSAMWQLDGACCANGSCDGCSDEPCQCEPAAKPTPQEKSGAEPTVEPAAEETPKKTGYFGTSEEPKTTTKQK
ncbi:hypothetical protein SEUCBS139899_009807 [Sporothrix eucalyptigena]|uniref:Metallothionein n=1 Tax=Sporothrix eucalyptigena TaxID=1812306 RepID=A0ABP0CZ74_9PEZI